MMKNLCYWYWNNIIPFEICQKLINLGKEWKQADTFESAEKGESLDDTRKSDIAWVNDQWVYDLISPYMRSANEQAGWKYDIVGVEDCQITRYTKDGFYTWHMDGLGSHSEVFDDPNNKFLYGYTRKLSMSVILNSDFEGGEFELAFLKKKDQVPAVLPSGSVIVFPSSMHHRVAPVTKGTRYSLVAWFVGPPLV